MKKVIVFIVLSLSLATLHAQKLNAEQQAIKKVFFDFLKFYQRNATTFNSFELYKGKGENNDPPFKIQWKEVEKYFAYLRKSVPYVGEAYIKAERAHFKYSDSCFKADPAEEIAVGFDYDRWGGGQEEIQYMIQWHTNPENTYEVSINGNKALLRIGVYFNAEGGEKYVSWDHVPFVKEKGKWKMADNIYPEPDEVETNQP